MKYTLIGLVIGGGISYYSYAQGIIDVPIALLLAAFGLLIGWGLDRPEVETGMEQARKDMVGESFFVPAIFVGIFGVVFLLASPLFDYPFQDYWPINGIWNFCFAIPILIVSIFFFLSGR